MFDLSQVISALKLKNQELLAEKELMRDRTGGISSRTSESKSDGDKSDSESDTQEKDRSERFKELQDSISTLNTHLTNFKEPSTPLEELTFKPPAINSNGIGSESKLT